MAQSSTPSYSEFDPRIIRYQGQVIDDLFNNFDYSLGTHEIMLSGSVGSAKSILMAHCAVRHCIENPRARLLLGRKALPDLKDTIFAKICEHLEGSFVEGKHYKINNQKASIDFCNGSKIFSRSWIDKKYKKFRSLELSAAVFEELTENDDEDKQAYDEIKLRLGRLPHIAQNWILAATNPDAPSHWAYRYFIDTDINTRHVYYSVTTDNPFLPAQYIDQLKKELDPKMARRMIYGEWIEIAGEVVYYQYDKTIQFIRKSYEINKKYPVIFSWDFNIGEGKPMSMCCMQFIDDTFHVFNEVVIHGARTSDTIDELGAKGLLNEAMSYYICGDAAGKHRDTRGTRSDYDIILRELLAKNLKVEFRVPPANPSVRNRHNLVNAYCRNERGDIRLFVYKDAPTVDEGLRLTKLKKGAAYIEDDSKSYQHITTALGYAMYFETLQASRSKQRNIIL